MSLALCVSTCRRVVFHLSLRCLPDWFPRCGFPDVVSQLPQGFLGCCLVMFHSSWRGGFPIIFQLPSTIPICLPELVCPLSPSVFHLSPRCFPVVFQDVVSHLSPSCFAFVLHMWSSNSLRFCSRCALPILSHLSSTQPPHRPVVCSQ